MSRVYGIKVEQSLIIVSIIGVTTFSCELTNLNVSLSRQKELLHLGS